MNAMEKQDEFSDDGTAVSLCFCCIGAACSVVVKRLDLDPQGP